MEVAVRDEGVLLQATNLAFENQAVLNPTCVTVDGITHMYYRAVRKGDMVSSIGYCQLVDGKIIYKADEPVLKPEHDYEQSGIEDPRITKLDDTYYLFYTVYDGKEAQVAYAISKDLKKFEKKGKVLPPITYGDVEQSFCSDSPAVVRFELYKKRYKFRLDPDSLLWEKDAILFPQKINGHYALLIRILPGIQIVYFNHFEDFNNKLFRRAYLANLDRYTILEPKFIFEHKHIGGGCVPIATDQGWVLIYHAVEDTPEGVIYHAAVALLDINDPTKVIGRLSYPLFSPTSEWEQTGDVNNVVFPTGTELRDGRLYIYYGAADKLIAVKSVILEELLVALKNSS